MSAMFLPKSLCHPFFPHFFIPFFSPKSHTIPINCFHGQYSVFCDKLGGRKDRQICLRQLKVVCKNQAVVVIHCLNQTEGECGEFDFTRVKQKMCKY